MDNESDLALGVYTPEGEPLLIKYSVESEFCGNTLPTKLAYEFLQAKAASDEKIVINSLSFTHKASFLPEMYPEEALLYIVHGEGLTNDLAGSPKIKTSLYRASSLFAKVGISVTDDSSIVIDPESFADSKQQSVMKNGNINEIANLQNDRFRVDTLFPVHVFYTMTVVELNEVIEKIIVAKHVLIFDDEPVLGGLAIRLAFTDNHGLRGSLLDEAKQVLREFLYCDFDFDDFSNIVKLFTHREGDRWMNLLHRFVWMWDGKPQCPDYGKKQFNYYIDRLSEQGIEYGFNPALLVMNYFKKKFIDELLTWLEES